MSSDDPYTPPEAPVDAPARPSLQALLDPGMRCGRVRFVVRIAGAPLMAFVGWLVAAAVFISVSKAGVDPPDFLPGLMMALLLFAGACAVLVFVTQRFHDLGRPAAWSLLMLAPGLNVLVLLALAMWPGTRGENAWGEPPSPPGALTAFLAVTLLVAVAMLGMMLWFAAQLPEDF